MAISKIMETKAMAIAMAGTMATIEAACPRLRRPCQTKDKT
jgi:hypothetical protein